MKRYLILLIIVYSGFSKTSYAAGDIDLQVKTYIGMNASILKYKLDTTYADYKIGYQGGFAFKINKGRKFAEIGFGFTRNYLVIDDISLQNLREEFQIQDPGVLFTGFQFPVVIGYKFVKTPMFKWQVYGGAVMSVNARTWLLDDGKRIDKVKTKDIGLKPVSFEMRLGTGFDIAFFFVDFDYDLGLNSLNTSTFRIQSHALNLKLGFIF